MMRLMYSVILFLSVCNVCFSQEGELIKNSPPAGNGLVGDFYGKDVSKASEDKAVSVGELERELKNFKKIENIVVKGTVTDVCPKKGCWLTIKTKNGSPFFVKMKDYAFFVPTSLKGKNIILEGVAEKKITSVDELKHYAKDAKKSKEEIDAIAIPKQEIRFMADAIKVVN